MGEELFLDCHVYASGSPRTNITGLSHLNGMTVDAIGDGVWVAGLTVSGGAVTLPVARSKVAVGLPYASILQPMRLDTDPASGNSQGLIKRIHHLALRLLDTGGLRLATSQADAAPVTVPLGSSIVSGVLFTGDKEVAYQGDYDEDATFVIRNLGAYPMTVLGVFVKYTVTGDV